MNCHRTIVFCLTTLAALMCSACRAAVFTDGVVGDNTKSLVYEAATGNVWLDIPSGRCAAIIEIFSDSDMLLGPPPGFVVGPFDTFTSRKVFLFPIGRMSGQFQVGQIFPAGLTQAFLADDLTINGGACSVDESGFRDVVYVVPEPFSACCAAHGFALGFVVLIGRRMRWRGSRAALRGSRNTAPFPGMTRIPNDHSQSIEDSGTN